MPDIEQNRTWHKAITNFMYNCKSAIHTLTGFFRNFNRTGSLSSDGMDPLTVRTVTATLPTLLYCRPSLVMYSLRLRNGLLFKKHLYTILLLLLKYWLANRTPDNVIEAVAPLDRPKVTSETWIPLKSKLFPRTKLMFWPEKGGAD